MPRAPNEKIVKAKELYLDGVKLVEIASQLEIPPGTVRRWKSTHNWDNERSDKKANVRKNKKGAQPGNKNATGGPPGNKKALKHGLFQKHLPPDCMEIFDAIETADPIDLLWDQIKIAYTNLIRSQQIMFVRDQDDTTKEIVVDGAESTVYNIQHAWEKQSNLLASQAKAQSVLKSMIKQYDDLTRSSMATEEQQARIDKLKCEVAKLSGESETFEDDGFIEALKGNIAKVWEDDRDD